MLLSEVQKLSREYFREVVAHRRHIHANPELSFEEYKTSAYVQKQLKALKIPFKAKVAGTGVVALIKGGKSSKKTIALRADMDALPILEANKVSYKSKNAGVMHACGHDVHTSSLLGACKILNEVKGHFAGTVKAIFQPAEEKLPGGAQWMIKEGVLKNPTPSSIIGQHVHPPLAVGKVGMKAGTYMASADEITLRIKGKGGHAAIPTDFIDPILIASNVLMSLQQVVSRKCNPTIPCVLSFGKIHSKGGAFNVIPSEVEVNGTFRTMDEKWRKQAHKEIKRIASNVAKAMGGKCEVEILVGYPSLKNDPVLTARAKEYAIAFMGKKNVIDLPIRMTAEDFAYFTQKTSACFYRLGTGNKSKGITSPVHTPTFNIDENALRTGMGLMAWMAICELGN